MSDQDSGKSIVLVEDDKFIARAYSDGLSRAGYTVHVAHDGELGLELIRKEQPSLVLLDLIMPVMNGFDVLNAIKQDPELKSVDVMVLSNLGQEADLEKAKSLGASDYLIKSDHSMKTVLERVSNHIGGVRKTGQEQGS